MYGYVVNGGDVIWLKIKMFFKRKIKILNYLKIKQDEYVKLLCQ